MKKMGNVLNLILIAVLFVACTPETPVAPAQIVIKNITEKNVMTGQVVQVKTFNQCDSSSPLKAEIQFSESSSQSSSEELVLGATVTGSGDIPGVAKIELQGSIEKHYATAKNAAQARQESVSIEVPAYTRQEYTIVWKEIRREGTVEYEENGETKFANYSYRIGLELDSSSSRDIDCSLPTETPLPTDTPTPVPSSTPEPIGLVPTETPSPKPIASNCIHSQFWTLTTSNENLLSQVTTNPDGCYSMEALNIFAGSDGSLYIKLREQKQPFAAGIHTSIKNNSVIEFSIFVNFMYIVYEDKPLWISFAVSPASEPGFTRSSARFNLHVENGGNDPIIHYVLADSGENTGTKLGSQHYEYGRRYVVRFELSGSVMKVYINNVKLQEELFIPAGQKAFYVGYNLPITSGADVVISNITIDGQPR